MGNIIVADYLSNLTKYDDIERDLDNRIVLDKYIERVHADGISCHRPYFQGRIEPKLPYFQYKIKTPIATYIAKERRNSPTPTLKNNVEKTTKVNNEAIWGKVYNDVGVNSVEAYVGYENTHHGRLFYSITQHLDSLKTINKEKLAYNAPNFFLHLTDMLEHKGEYLQHMTPAAFDDLVNALIAAVISGETDMNGCNTILLKYPIGKKFTDVCRVGLEDHAYDDFVEGKSKFKDIKDNFNRESQVYGNSFGSANSTTVISPRTQILTLREFALEGKLSESNIALIERLANYDIDRCIEDRKDNAGAHLTQSHIDAIKFYLSQAEQVL